MYKIEQNIIEPLFILLLEPIMVQQENSVVLVLVNCTVLARPASECVVKHTLIAVMLDCYSTSNQEWL